MSISARSLVSRGFTLIKLFLLSQEDSLLKGTLFLMNIYFFPERVENGSSISIIHLEEASKMYPSFFRKLQ